MKKYDLTRQGVISFADFFDMVVPFEKEYRDKLEKKEPNNNSCCCPCEYKCIANVFSESTSNAFGELMNYIIESERKLNQIRKGLTQMNVKLTEIFRKIDWNNKGYFDNNDFKNYLKQYGIFTGTREADLLFIRLDKNRDGKIVFEEVSAETHPTY